MARLGPLLTVSGWGGVELLENQALTAFFQLRVSIIPPENIVILAIDDQSISIPEQYYKTDPQQYGYLVLSGTIQFS
jgi:CHASE2 domain-containing sensor protein